MTDSLGAPRAPEEPSKRDKAVGREVPADESRRYVVRTLKCCAECRPLKELVPHQIRALFTMQTPIGGPPEPPIATFLSCPNCGLVYSMEDL